MGVLRKTKGGELSLFWKRGKKPTNNGENADFRARLKKSKRVRVEKGKRKNEDSEQTIKTNRSHEEGKYRLRPKKKRNCLYATESTIRRYTGEKNISFQKNMSKLLCGKKRGVADHSAKVWKTSAAI